MLPDTTNPNSLLVITGAMGAGKSSVLGEASDILALRQVVHAAIDLDGLGLVYLPSLPTDHAMCRNLRSVCENYMAIGVRRFLVARAIENRAQLEVCRDAISATNIVVCRLTASLETMRQRVRPREKGVSRPDYVARVEKLNDILDRAQLEDFVVVNDNRSLTDVALEVLVKAGWIPN